MLLADSNLLFFYFLMLIGSLALTVTTTLHVLLTAELLWINLFSLALSIGLVWNNLNVLALTFFFLVLSAIEFGIGLILMLLQNVVTRSISILDTHYNFTKFAQRFKTNAFVNRTSWRI